MKPGDTDWDEFKDIEIVDWKRVRSAIEHENTLVNHRLTWLFSSQLFLFAFFGLVFVSWIKKEPNNDLVYFVPFVIGAISILAIVICMVIFCEVNSATTQLDSLQKWWDYRYRKNHKRDEKDENHDERHPPIQLWKGKPHVLLRLLWSELIPIWFLVTWLCLFLAIACNLLSPIKDIVDTYGIYILLAVVLQILIVTLAVIITIRVGANKKPNNPPNPTGDSPPSPPAN
ncbi:MAG: hypothetical protein P9F75_05520 [Candidatus Contendobacter sp.]|nr:hypothetical protein [Candidatus Contendobacter sp.]